MYSLNWKAEGRPCLVIGAGHVALRKIRGLLAEGAAVTVIAPEAAPEIRQLAREGRVRWLERQFDAKDTAGYDLIVTTTGIAGIAEEVSRAAGEGRVLYNAADFPELGNCTVPAKLRRGDFSIAISTEGRSPAFSRYMKEWLAAEIPENIGEWLERVARVREEAKEIITTSAGREAFWHLAFEGKIRAFVAEGDLDRAEECLRHAMGRFGAEPQDGLR